ncbi:MAG: CehA/McbA family metallohydrolase [Anaerolineae bacterium]|nr:CehA/McbA family metallohydrolase [Anaerolineae bacterium]
MASILDGPCSPHFWPLPFRGSATLPTLPVTAPGDIPPGISAGMLAALEHAPRGSTVSWGIPFEIGDVLVLSDAPLSVQVEPTRARWLVFLHTLDACAPMLVAGGVPSPSPRSGRLGAHAASYVISYAGGTEARAAIRRRHQVGAFTRPWGEHCFEAVAHHKPHRLGTAAGRPPIPWGWAQMRVSAADEGPWVNWLWAWQNPFPDRTIAGFRFEPAAGAEHATVVISAISAGDVDSLPLRWQPRRKARLTLPAGESFQPELDGDGLLRQVQLDLGQVISATRRLVYPNEAWPETYNDLPPELSPNELLVEYTSHPGAHFHLFGAAGSHAVPVSVLEAAPAPGPIHPVAPAEQRVTLRIVERGSTRPVPVKLHVHGESGEYLAPVDRHRILNPSFFEDYSVDALHMPDWSAQDRAHACTYIPGETTLKLPLGRVYVEVSKGFEIRPVRTVVDVTAGTSEITIEIEKVLPWRERGWVTADTHVHFLSPMSAMLEGSAEGVNVVNLLSSQWGEMMSNVGDFDGKSTWGSKEAGGDGEYLVRVGTENRQHVLGHISLLGYSGPIIAPLTTGGPDESALGDPVEVLLLEWARQCRAQGGLVVVPHFPRPCAEHAAAIISGDVDAVEMTSWDNRYRGIDPYSIADWYRYLNCGYLVPAVGGTDKMAAVTAVGTVRTYARIPPGVEFTYDAWKDAIRRGETFVTYGPLLEFLVDGRPAGSRIAMSRAGGTVDVTWQVASVTIPMTRVELVVNGEIRESAAVSPGEAAGQWSVRVETSAWLALLVRGGHPGRPEMVAAHSTPVIVDVEGSPLLAAADAVTILEQIEGAIAYLDTVGTRADDRAYKRMRLALSSAHRDVHNRLHQEGMYHEHTPTSPHDGH